MVNRRRNGSRRGSTNPLAAAPLCVEEQYYHELARPLLRHGAERRARDLTALLGPLLAIACALFIGLSLTLTAPARVRHPSPLTLLQARLAGMPPALTFALVGAGPLLLALALASLWARRDLTRERRIRETLEAKLRLARGYRAYLMGLATLTEPMTWLRRLAAFEGATDAGPSVLVALSLTHDPRWDEPHEPTLGGDERPSRDGGARQATRYGWEASVEQARRESPQRRAVESVTQALADSPSGAIILTGGEGAGKTTLMRYVARAQALAQLQRTRPGGRIPLYADLGWLELGWPAHDASSIEPALTALAQRIGGVESQVARELARAMTHEPALLLFDELDTLPGEQREQAASALATFLVGRGRPARANPTTTERGADWTAQVVLGARSYAGPLGEGPAYARFQQWEVEPLAFPMGRLALTRGAQASLTGAATSQNSGAAEALLRALAAPQTETWLTQPLALTLAALAGIGAPDTAPCHSRTDLYATAALAALRMRLPEWEDDERRALLLVAGEMALWMQVHGRRFFHPGVTEADHHLRRLPETQAIAARLGAAAPSEALATLSGLCETGPDGLACFSLPTLHSFLAGSALARRLSDELPAPLAPDALTHGTLTDDSRPNTLAQAWATRASAHWSDTLVFMCGALCSLLAPMDAPRRDIAVAWLHAQLTQRDDLAEAGLPLAALSLPELRGDPAGATLASDIASRLYRALRSRGPAATRAKSDSILRASVAIMADPMGRETLLDLLRARLLGEHEQAMRQAAQTFGALGQAGVQVAPLLIELLDATIWAPRAAVARAIGALGPAFGAEAIPALIAAQDDHTPIVRKAVTEALGATIAEPDDAITQALLALLTDHDGEVRAAAAAALGRQGTHFTQTDTATAQTVAESLIQALSDGEGAVQVAAALALRALPNAAQQVPALISALGAIGWSDRAAAALALGELGPVAAPALPGLMTLAREDVVIGRATATRALAQIGPQRADVVAALVARLADEAPETRAAAADALALMDSALPELRRQAWPALLNALRDSRGSVRSAAGRALAALGATDDPRIMAALLALLDDAHGYVRAVAALPLETLGGAAARNLPTRIASLGGLSDEVCLVAVDALGIFGASARVAVPALTSLLNEQSWEVRLAVLRALRRIEPRRVTVSAILARMSDTEAPVRMEAIAALDALDHRSDRLLLPAIQQRLLGDSDSRVRAAAATALGRMGPRAATALPALLRALSDVASETQRAAALAIGALQPTLPAATTQLIEQLSDRSPGVRAAVALAFGALGQRAAATTEPELRTLLKDEDNVTRAAAAEALGLLGPQVSAATRQALLQRLDDADGETRAAAALAIGRVGAGDGDPQVLLDALGVRTYDRRYIARRAAVEALTMLGPAAALTALPRLLELLGDPDALTRRAVIAALGTLDATGQAEALPTLRLALNATLASGRAAATLALASMPSLLEASDHAALIALLADADETTRVAATQTIGALSDTAFHGEAPPDALGALLGDEGWQARAAAAEALGAFGARAPGAERSALRAALADPDETVRQAAAKALTRIDPDGVKALVGELVGAIKSRRATGALAPLAQRRELEIYAAMERPSWPVAQRVASWLGEDAHWATLLDICALIECWRYAPMAARQRLLWWSERASYPVVQQAARRALRAALAESPDIDPPETLDLHDLGAQAARASFDAARPRGETSASRTQAASDRLARAARLHLSGDAGKTA